MAETEPKNVCPNIHAHVTTEVHSPLHYHPVQNMYLTHCMQHVRLERLRTKAIYFYWKSVKRK